MAKIEPKPELTRVSFGGDPEFLLLKNSEEIDRATMKEMVETMNNFKYDGACIEYNIKPTSCRETLSHRILINKNLTKKSAVAAIINLNTLDTEEKKLGCADSLNAYMPWMKPDENIPIRSAGAHMHFGLTIDGSYIIFKLKDTNGKIKYLNFYGKELDSTEEHLKKYYEIAEVNAKTKKEESIHYIRATKLQPYLDCRKDHIANNARGIIKKFDRTVGLMSVIFAYKDAAYEALRRYAYGQAGEYRTNDHGIEYRVPSVATIRKRRMPGLLYGVARSIIRGQVPDSINRTIKDYEVIRAINNSDFEEAITLLKRIENKLPLVARMKIERLVSLMLININKSQVRDTTIEWGSLVDDEKELILEKVEEYIEEYKEQRRRDVAKIYKDIENINKKGFEFEYRDPIIGG